MAIQSDPPTLVQQRFTTRFEFTLLPDSVQLFEKRMTTSRTVKMPYIEFPNEPAEVTVSSSRRFWAMVITCVLAISSGADALAGEKVLPSALVSWTLFFLIAAVAFWSSWQRYLVFSSQAVTLTFFPNRPDKETVNNFIKQIHERKRVYLMERYLDASNRLSLPDELRKLAWLHENGSLTTEEFQEFKESIIARSKAPKFDLGLN